MLTLTSSQEEGGEVKRRREKRQRKTTKIQKYAKAVGISHVFPATPSQRLETAGPRATAPASQSTPFSCASPQTFLHHRKKYPRECTVETEGLCFQSPPSSLETQTGGPISTRWTDLPLRLLEQVLTLPHLKGSSYPTDALRITDKINVKKFRSLSQRDLK